MNNVTLITWFDEKQITFATNKTNDKDMDH